MQAHEQGNPSHEAREGGKMGKGALKSCVLLAPSSTKRARRDNGSPLLGSWDLKNPPGGGGTGGGKEKGEGGCSARSCPPSTCGWPIYSRINSLPLPSRHLLASGQCVPIRLQKHFFHGWAGGSGGGFVHVRLVCKGGIICGYCRQHWRSGWA